LRRVRWPVLSGVTAEGLLLVPSRIRGAVVLLPDAAWTPEMLCGVSAGAEVSQGVVSRLAAVDLLVPWLRSELGDGVSGELPIGVGGVGEGGRIALAAAAVDERICSCWVAGYFQQREGLWQEPLDRNVWRMLTEFGDAEQAGMVAPRRLVLEACRVPEFGGVKETSPGRVGEWLVRPGEESGWPGRQSRLRVVVRDELIGRLPHVPVDPRPRSRRILETAESVGYEVWLEVFEDVVAGGILLLPRVLQRMSNPLGRSLFSLIVSQHQQLLRWLKTVPGGGLFGFWGRIAPSPPAPLPRWGRGVPQIVNAVRVGVREGSGSGSGAGSGAGVRVRPAGEWGQEWGDFWD